MIVHRLDGCTPTPLASYLKALGVLRLVAEQLDPTARGFWDGERFVLVSTKNEEEVVRFFLERYAPTPLVAPWNKGSGFFAGDQALSPAEASTAPRFERLRVGIMAAKANLTALAAADTAVRKIKESAKVPSAAQRAKLKQSDTYKTQLAAAEREFKRLKADLIPNLRSTWRGPHREWLDAAIVLDSEGAASFPALLGTGGNDGRLDFTNNFFQRLSDLFDMASSEGRHHDGTEPWIRESLFGATARVMVSGMPVGQFAPAGAGGANMSYGEESDSRMNPADFVLMLEGAVLFTATANRRWEATSPSRASAPFSVSGQSAGYFSAAASEGSTRGEQWMPLWPSPMTLQELKRLLAEGRAQIGTKRAKDSLDLARAVGRLGTARGICAFQRFGYMERNGQSNLAVPLGRFVVPEARSPRLACLDDLDAWLPRLRREARTQQAPARLLQAERRLVDSLFAVSQHPDDAQRWQATLLRLANIEALQLTGSGYKAGPIPRLRPEWVEAADDGSAELRLAVAFALQAGAFGPDWIPRRGSGVRRHWLTLERGRYVTSGTGGQQRLQTAPGQVMHGRNGVDDAIAILVRRSIEASQSGTSESALIGGRHAFAAVGDLTALLSGIVDLDRTLSLARALMAVDSRAWARRPAAPRAAPAGDSPDDGWLAIRLAQLPWSLPSGQRVGHDPAILRRLETGDAAGAFAIARRRLCAAGVRPAVASVTVPPATARLWAAALAFPITKKTADDFLARLDPNAQKETAA